MPDAPKVVYGYMCDFHCYLLKDTLINAQSIILRYCPSINRGNPMHQFSFEDVTYQSRSKKTRNQRFLEQMDAVLPWKAFLSELEPFYSKGARGRPPIDMEIMLRIYFMQQWFGYSDPGMEDALHDNIAMRRFARLEAGYAPDETTICKFRHWLEERELTKMLFSVSGEHLRAHGIMVREGSIVDATVISAPTSTKNRSKQRDPQMKSTRKANQWHFGMKAHIGADTRGYVHSVEVTAANVHDVTMMDVKRQQFGTETTRIWH